ncbi:hypothetical protein K469DRAFT_389739 [Zopfia rhizophila CBS 207.26]|uniref:Uncharacterized protein n=1 Tax=Zopfia rhizophila CBS 207.26 TaxID=1314779 RepID=A0A6A6EIZ5_9PEZI|nr:hypothetical protein K469DRAFT_389739 [Zopfia rhizophila CBS 207.26]
MSVDLEWETDEVPLEDESEASAEYEGLVGYPANWDWDIFIARLTIRLDRSLPREIGYLHSDLWIGGQRLSRRNGRMARDYMMNLSHSIARPIYIYYDATPRFHLHFISPRPCRYQNPSSLLRDTIDNYTVMHRHFEGRRVFVALRSPTRFPRTPKQFVLALSPVMFSASRWPRAPNPGLLDNLSDSRCMNFAGGLLALIIFSQLAEMMERTTVLNREV